MCWSQDELSNSAADFRMARSSGGQFAGPLRQYFGLFSTMVSGKTIDFPNKTNPLLPKCQKHSCVSENRVYPQMVFCIERNQKTKHYALGMFQTCLDKSIWKCPKMESVSSWVPTMVPWGIPSGWKPQQVADWSTISCQKFKKSCEALPGIGMLWQFLSEKLHCPIVTTVEFLRHMLREFVNANDS